ncbi:uncharacterized protein LOC122312608 [Carya illinoinensis]|uniref:uncharacterized protein LOC122312608 n=1 Tax=Carya illinoinensis TaxID=32201 RepID=UPI001C726CD6|nr:uncharacterized protein LOC122312608 [Carya illinoinensis]
MRRFGRKSLCETRGSWYTGSESNVDKERGGNQRICFSKIKTKIKCLLELREGTEKVRDYFVITQRHVGCAPAAPKQGLTRRLIQRSNFSTLPVVVARLRLNQNHHSISMSLISRGIQFPGRDNESLAAIFTPCSVSDSNYDACLPQQILRDFPVQSFTAEQTKEVLDVTRNIIELLTTVLHTSPQQDSLKRIVRIERVQLHRSESKMRAEVGYLLSPIGATLHSGNSLTRFDIDMQKI